jgi:protocatechuate 3,4-dioxygenase beta subunit
MKTTSLALFLFVVAMTPSLGQVVEDKRPASVSGSVLRAGTTEPVRGAQMELVPSEVGTLADYDYNPAILNALKSRSKSFTAITDNKGAFSFADVVPGQYRLSAVRDGYGRTEYLQRGANDRGAVVEIPPGGRLSDLVIAMAPASTISGTVVDENGSPAAYASVEALAVQWFPGGVRRLRLVQTADVDDLGDFRLYWLSPGDYYVAVEYRDGGVRHELFPATPQTRSNLPLPEVEYPTYYYPGTPDLSAAQVIHLGNSSEVPGIRFRLQPAPLATLRGSVTNLPTGPLKPVYAQILLAPTALADGGFSFHYRSDDRGKFEIRGVAPGSYLIKAVAGVSNLELNSSVVRVEVGSKDVENIAVPLSPGITVRGRVQLDGTPGPLPFDVSLAFPQLTGSLGRGESFTGRVSADGSFTADGGFPGKFQVSIMGLPEGYYLKQVLQGSKDVLESDVQLGGDNSSSIDVILGRNRKSLTGTVLALDSKPASGAIVVLVPNQLQKRADRYRRIVTDAQGQFRIVGMPPGTYTAYAFDEILSDAFYDPDFLRLYTGRGVDVTINDVTDSIANPRLIPVQR